MRLYIKNHLFGLKGSSSVVDERGISVFQVEGKAMSPTHKKFICDLRGNKLFTVRNKFWRLFRRSALVYGQNGEKIGKMKERLFVGLEFIDDYGIEVKGKLFQGIQVLRNGQLIGWFCRKYNSALLLERDTYTLDVYNSCDAALLVAIVIAYDNICDDRRD